MATPQSTGITLSGGFQLTNGYTFAGPPSTDPYWENVSYLSQTTPVNAAQNNTFLDSSTNNATLTRTGTPTQGTATPFSNNWSNYFPGSAYLTAPSNTALAIGTGQYTFEMWLYFDTVTATNEIFRTSTDTTSGRFALYYASGSLQVTATGGAGATSASYTFVAGQWYHVAASRDASNNQRLFVNGVLLATATSANNYSQTGMTLGAGQSSGNMNGYISNLRLLTGTALYTANFTPSTTPLTPNANTALLICQSPVNIDNSPNALTLTATGTQSIQRFNPFSTYLVTPITYSTYFPSASYLSSPASASNQLTGDFTIECWVYPLAVGAQAGLVNITNTASSGANGLSVYLDTSNKVTFYVNGNATVTSSPINAVSANTWYHIALVRNSTTNTLYINGTSVATSSTTPTWPATPTIGIGRVYNDNTSFTLNGYLSNVRIVKGTAVYTTNFTPPTTPLTAITNTYLLTCQSPTIVDNSTNAIALTVTAGTPTPKRYNPFGYTTSDVQMYDTTNFGGSIYFNSSTSTDYIQTSTYNASLNPGSSDFTIEFWVYPLSTGRQDWFNLQAATGFNRILVYYTAAGNVQYDAGVGSAAASRISAAVSSTTFLNQWHHVALSRNSGSSRLFFDGVQIGSTFADTLVWTNNLQFTTGKDPGGSTVVNGYTSNMRFIVGTGLYAANFVPPLAPLTAVTNTQLLLNSTNAGLYDASMSGNFITVGNAQVSTTVTQYGTSSMAFDGTLDSIYTVDKPSINFGTGDFTLECWVYFNAVNAEMCLINKGWQQSGSLYASYLIYMTSAGSLRFNASSAGSSWDIASDVVIGTMTAGTWTNIAVTRSGTTFRAFINGAIVSGFTFTSASSLANLAAQALYIGGRVDGSSSLNGYLSDVRITKGVARYTSSYTLPTNTLPNA